MAQITIQDSKSSTSTRMQVSLTSIQKSCYNTLDKNLGKHLIIDIRYVYVNLYIRENIHVHTFRQIIIIS